MSMSLTNLFSVLLYAYKSKSEVEVEKTIENAIKTNNHT